MKKYWFSVEMASPPRPPSRRPPQVQTNAKICYFLQDLSFLQKKHQNHQKQRTNIKHFSFVQKNIKNTAKLEKTLKTNDNMLLGNICARYIFPGDIYMFTQGNPAISGPLPWNDPHRPSLG